MSSACGLMPMHVARKYEAIIFFLQADLLPACRELGIGENAKFAFVDNAIISACDATLPYNA